MSKPDAHYIVSLVNHQTGQQLKLELIDLQFPALNYRLRVNGRKSSLWPARQP